MAAPAMDATALLEEQKRKRKAVNVERELPPTLDLALLAVFDPNLLDEEAYRLDREAYLSAQSRDGVQLLVNAIFNRSTTVSDDGIMASLPTEAVTLLPREKPLPKPKPPTKWEKFAKEKGIVNKSRKDRLIFDEEKQDWVPSYGYKGKNKDAEDQWLVEVPANKDANFDPRAAAKEERKARKLKNESQRLRNEANAAASSSSKKAAAGKALAAPPTELDRQSRKAAVERDLLSTKKSTASLGRYDKTLTGEEAVLGRRPKGEKRKFDANEMAGTDERERGLKLLKTLGTGGGSGGKRTDGETAPLVNARKAIRSASGGRGAAALASRGGAKRGRGRGRGGRR